MSATAKSTPVATSANALSASLRSEGSSARRSKIVVGAHRRSSAIWKRAPARERRCEIPRIFLPPQVSSPGPRPAKHTRSDQRVRTERPACSDSDGSRTPRSTSARRQASPTHCAATTMSSDHRGSPGVITRSAQTTSSGVSNTAPPPLERRTTSTPARSAAARSTTDIGWAEPSTSTRRSIVHHVRVGRSGHSVRASANAEVGDAERCSVVIALFTQSARHRRRRGPRARAGGTSSRCRAHVDRPARTAP